MPGSVMAIAVIELARRDARQPTGALLVVAVAEEVRQADVVVQGDAEPGRVDAGGLDLLADDEVVAEVVDAAAAVLGRDRHAEEPVLARGRRTAREERSRASSHSR